jgi:hypothetical protein
LWLGWEDEDHLVRVLLDHLQVERVGELDAELLADRPARVAEQPAQNSSSRSAR